MDRTLINYLVITLKGIAMGAADVVPGVSGGTIAFISGIYEELLASINAINFKTLTILRKEGVAAAWKSINGNFLLALLLGIGLSIVSLAKLIKYLLATHPILVWAFFFGLVLASVIYVGKQIDKWNVGVFIALIIGVAVGYYLTIIPAVAAVGSSSLFLFFAGALAICAMILPGISGGYILLLLGAYRPVLDAVDERDIKTIAILGAGAIVGILSFSRLLKWLFETYRNITLAVLTGFIIGSLNKIWPWKRIVDSVVIEGKVKVLHEESILPNQFNGDPQVLYAILLALIGFVFIVLLESSVNIKTKK
ncbi:DUF368 domain-containing protein [Flavobacteriaceae bacterium F08102]|nr:DUF368 domain-containing protein [Flavobacteriaceae bacterium F08102]